MGESEDLGGFGPGAFIKDQDLKLLKTKLIIFKITVTFFKINIFFQDSMHFYFT